MYCSTVQFCLAQTHAPKGGSQSWANIQQLAPSMTGVIECQQMSTTQFVKHDTCGLLYKSKLHSGRFLVTSTETQGVQVVHLPCAGSVSSGFPINPSQSERITWYPLTPRKEIHLSIGFYRRVVNINVFRNCCVQKSLSSLEDSNVISCNIYSTD